MWGHHGYPRTVPQGSFDSRASIRGLSDGRTTPYAATGVEFLRKRGLVPSEQN